MIYLKVIVFFFALAMTIVFIEDAIERIILNSKREYNEYHCAYTQGRTALFTGWSGILSILGWTGLYLLNLLS